MSVLVMVEVSRERLKLTFAARLSMEGEQLPTLEQVQETVLKWAERSASRNRNAIEFGQLRNLTDGQTRVFEGENFEVKVQKYSGKWGLSYSSQNPSSIGETWQTSVQIRDDEEAGYRITIECTTNASDPIRTTPGIVRDLIDACSEAQGGYGLYPERQELKQSVDDEIQKPCLITFPLLSTSISTSSSNDQLILDFINDPQRSLPVILCSPTRQGIYPIKPDALAFRLAGQAHVFRVPKDHDFSRRAEWTLNNGGVAIPYGGYISTFYPMDQEGNWERYVLDATKYKNPQAQLENNIRIKNLSRYGYENRRPLQSYDGGRSLEPVEPHEELDEVDLSSEEIKGALTVAKEYLSTIAEITNGEFTKSDRSLVYFKGQLDELQGQFATLESSRTGGDGSRSPQVRQKIRETAPLIKTYALIISGLKQLNDKLLNYWVETQERQEQAGRSQQSKEGGNTFELTPLKGIESCIIYPTLESVQDMVLKLEEKFGDKILFLESAKKGAKNMDKNGLLNQTKREGILGYMFLAISELIYLKEEQLKTGEQNRIRDTSEMLGSKVAYSIENAHTLANYPEQRKYVYNEQSYVASAHLKIGKRPRECLRIYVHLDKSRDQGAAVAAPLLVITHITDHFKTSKSRKDGGMR